VSILAAFLTAPLGFTGAFAGRNLINSHIEENCSSRFMIELLLTRSSSYCNLPNSTSYR